EAVFPFAGAIGLALKGSEASLQLCQREGLDFRVRGGTVLGCRRTIFDGNFDITLGTGFDLGPAGKSDALREGDRDFYRFAGAIRRSEERRVGKECERGWAATA